MKLCSYELIAIFWCSLVMSGAFSGGNFASAASPHSCTHGRPRCGSGHQQVRALSSACAADDNVRGRATARQASASAVLNDIDTGQDLKICLWA